MPKVDPTNILDHQFAPITEKTYRTDYSLENDLKKSYTCRRSSITQNISLNNFSNNVIEPKIDLNSDFKPSDLVINNNVMSMLNIGQNMKPINSSNTLLSKNEFDDLTGYYGINCTQKKKDLDHSDYFPPAYQMNGRGFGNPENYKDTYLGEPSRLFRGENIRSKDMTERTMIPIDSFRINYSNIPYENEVRGGVMTRTYKKSITNF